jgi:hypothetical protein
MTQKCLFFQISFQQSCHMTQSENVSKTEKLGELTGREKEMWDISATAGLENDVPVCGVSATEIAGFSP